MDKDGLIEALTAADVPRGIYIVEGIEALLIYADPYITLREEGGQWVVGTVERGVAGVVQAFETEAEACQRMFDMLTYVEPPKHVTTPEEEAVSREHHARIQERGRRESAELLARYRAEHGE
jgi:hypothetical protein